MFDLRWSWLCLPYAVCAAALAAIGVVAAVVRGDRVMRLGVIGAAITALPWALCTALACGTDDPAVATRLYRLGSGPVSLIGPNFLLVLLGVSGQLEHHRWAARLAGLVGAVLLGLCWGTDWTVPGVHRLSSGMLYVSAGPLTDFHISQLAMWLAVGLVIARRSMMRGERRRMMRVLVAAFVLAAIGGTDMLLVHGVVGFYPAAWLSATIACGITLHLELRSDLLRPRGVDRAVALELAGFVAAAVGVGAAAFALRGAAAVEVSALGSAVWIVVIATMWALGRRRRPPRVFGERALGRFVAGLTDLDDDRPIADGLAALWREVAVTVRAVWRVERARLVDLATGAEDALDPEVGAWLVGLAEPLATMDLATMRLGPLRPRIEALAAARGASLFVPLIDRQTLVGLVEADHERALREAERGLVAESARAAARALTYVQLARAAAREGVAAREVEVAEAMRLQASAGRDDELGPWQIAVEYRSAQRTTGAAWSASLLDDGRLALVVTEGQAHGVVSALATAALTGAFAAATTAERPTLDALVATLGASAEGALRGGEPVAAFIAILDPDARTIAWSCAGHPGAVVLAAGPGPDPVALGGGGARLGEPAGGALRGEAALGPDALLVVASSGVRGKDSSGWVRRLGARGLAAPGGPRLAGALVESAAGDGPPARDLLAVVVRQRGEPRRGAD
ncbi:MAG TPA: SpoIIE family protein phosphatase [Kofleriaceae bacterium]|nr:SpoIIE family protein phosphatase [Kofleriaceae bacterium]